MPGEGARTVGEAEPCVRRELDHVRALVAAVGDQRDPAEPHQPGKIASERQVGVRHDDTAYAEAGELGDARLHGAVQSPTWLPQDDRPLAACPVGDLRIVADDRDRQGRRGSEHLFGHAANERPAIRVVERAREPALGVGERLDRHEHGLLAGATPRCAPLSSSSSSSGSGSGAGDLLVAGHALSLRERPQELRRSTGGARTGDAPSVGSGRVAGSSVHTEGVTVVGAGSWGTTIASLAAGKGPTTLWARSPELAEELVATRENRRYLPGIVLPATLRATSSLPDAVEHAAVVLVAVPSHGFRAVLEVMEPVLPARAAVVSLAKGIEAGTNRRMSEIVAEVLPGRPVGVLTGPNLSHEVAVGHPAATVVACDDEEVARSVQEALHCSTFRVYTATDVVGCEIAAASKNVIAIAAGVCDGLGFGGNTRAVLITRGLAEQVRLGLALGGHAFTFGGLAGVGDLVATCTSPKSRNRWVGLELGRGRRLHDVVSEMHMVAEGVRTAGPLVALAEAHGVEMPIAAQVDALLAGRTSPADALEALMERPPRPEWDDAVVRELSS